MNKIILYFALFTSLTFNNFFSMNNPEKTSNQNKNNNIYNNNNDNNNDNDSDNDSGIYNEQDLCDFEAENLCEIEKQGLHKIEEDKGSDAYNYYYKENKNQKITKDQEKLMKKHYQNLSEGNDISTKKFKFLDKNKNFNLKLEAMLLKKEIEESGETENCNLKNIESKNFEIINNLIKRFKDVEIIEQNETEILKLLSELGKQTIESLIKDGYDKKLNLMVEINQMIVNQLKLIEETPTIDNKLQLIKETYDQKTKIIVLELFQETQKTISVISKENTTEEKLLLANKLLDKIIHQITKNLQNYPIILNLIIKTFSEKLSSILAFTGNQTIEEINLTSKIKKLMNALSCISELKIGIKSKKDKTGITKLIEEINFIKNKEIEKSYSNEEEDSHDKESLHNEENNNNNENF